MTAIFEWAILCGSPFDNWVQLWFHVRLLEPSTKTALLVDVESGLESLLPPATKMTWIILSVENDILGFYSTLSIDHWSAYAINKFLKLYPTWPSLPWNFVQEEKNLESGGGMAGRLSTYPVILYLNVTNEQNAVIISSGRSQYLSLVYTISWQTNIHSNMWK